MTASRSVILLFIVFLLRGDLWLVTDVQIVNRGVPAIAAIIVNGGEIVDFICATTFGMAKTILKLVNDDEHIVIEGNYLKQYTPYMSFTFNRQQMIAIRDFINQELEKDNVK